MTDDDMDRIADDMDRIAGMHGLPFKTDKVALDAERAVATQVLEVLAAGYGAMFDKVSDMEPAIMHTTTTYHPAPHDQVFEHQEVAGKGDTADEAIADWQRELAARPCSGRHLMWRWRPEIDHFKDFQMQKVIWRVYSRFVVLP